MGEGERRWPVKMDRMERVWSLLRMSSRGFQRCALAAMVATSASCDHGSLENLWRAVIDSEC